MSTVHYTQCPLCHSTDLKEEMQVKDHSISRQTFPIVRCQKCSFLFTQDVPDEDSIGPYYESEDYISHSDTKAGLVNRLYHVARDWMLSRKQKLVEQATGHKAGRLLDVGCGTGYFPNHMKQHGWSVLGVEPDPAARDFGREQFGLEVLPPDAAFFEANLEPVQAVTYWHVMEHIHRWTPYLEKTREVLEDDGVLVIAVPNHTSGDAQHYRAYWAAYDVPRHLWHFSPATMKNLLEQHGFRLTDKKPMPLDAFYCSMLSEKYQGHSLGLVRGAVQGTLSNLKAGFGAERCSSTIYVARKA